MTHWQEMVREFRARMEQPPPPAQPELRITELSARLIAEEAAETLVGLVGAETACDLLEYHAQFNRTKNTKPDLVETVDGLCDLIYVALGAAEAIGVDLAPVFAIVHAANMAKTPTTLNEHGKRGGKPEGWVDPKIIIREYLKTLEV